MFLVLSFALGSLYVPSICAVSSSVTDEKLAYALQRYMLSDSNDQNYKITVENKAITVNSNDGSHIITYDLTDNPTFSYTVDIEQGMDYKTFKEKTDKLSIPMLGYLAIANINEVEFEDASLYFIMWILSGALEGEGSESIMIVPDGYTVTGDGKIVKESGFGNYVMEYVNTVYREKTSIIDKESLNSFEWILEKKDVSAFSCKLITTLKVNLEADFSQLKGISDSSMNNNNNTPDQTEPVVSTFIDVKGTKYEQAVGKLGELGVINGFEDNTFRPTNNVTRAQFAKMIVEALQLKPNSNSNLVNFSDVSETHWAHNYIKVAVDNGVINGYPDDTFKPENPVTYAEAMTMILRAMKLEETMIDRNWPLGYINEAKKLGLLDDVDYTGPNITANRGETAISLFNMINKMNEK